MAACVQVERTVMLVNCGACEDVRAMLELPRKVRVIVIDAHRPIHHSYNKEDDVDTLFLHDPADGTAAQDIPLASDSESSGSGAQINGVCLNEGWKGRQAESSSELQISGRVLSL
jgi:CDC45-like protein